MAVVRSSDQNIPRDMALAGKTRSLWGDAWRRLRRNKLAVGGVVVLVLMSMIAIFADVIAPYEYDQTVRDPATRLTIRNQPPSADHLFGTDDLSRDEFSRVVYG
ncbi:MAG TPA: ABC transporter permease, partial [Chloroflexia bacterium]|nr:ABC transporter permease [Chloroflexia bacterium]